jgi:steroid delta-isomerase|tara:strand:+ start:539 stop:892 length:354 start_codon:yes stop_codon:yes gene_type:complete
MGGEAYDVIKQFWSNQDSGDYTRTAHMFSEDAVFDDPIFGTFNGRSEISQFLEKMNTVVGSINGKFRLEELAGDDHTAWAQWSFTSDDGPREGVGVYRVKDGYITYYRDYMNEAESS